MDKLIYAIIFLPFVASIIIYNTIFSDNEKTVRIVSKIFATSTLFLSLILLVLFDFSQPDYAIETDFRWINILGININFTVDAISLLFTVLAAFIFLIAIHTSKGIIKKNYKLYYSLLIFIQTAINGCLFSKDMFLFLTFSLLAIMPAFLIILKWGSANREQTAIKYVIYKAFSFVFIFAGFLILYFLNLEYTGILSADIYDIDATQMPDIIRNVVFFLFLTGLVINISVVPFHRWNIEGQVNAPTPLSIIIQAVINNVSAFCILRFILLFFYKELSIYSSEIILLSFISIFYTLICMTKEQELKKIIAYTSIFNTGIFLIGFASATTEGITGAIYQLFSYSLIICGLYLSENYIFRRTGTGNIKKLCGLKESLRTLMFVLFIFIAAYSFIPLFSGFNVLIMIITGAFMIHSTSIINAKMLTMLSYIIIMISGINLLCTYNNIFSGELSDFLKNKNIKDIKTKQLAFLITIAIILIFLGFFPSLTTEIITDSVNNAYNLIGAY